VPFSGEREGRRELFLQPAEDGLGRLGKRRLEIAAETLVAGPVVLRLRGSESALPQELKIAVDEGEAIDAVAEVELGESPFLETLEEAGRRSRLRLAPGRLDQRRGHP